MCNQNKVATLEDKLAAERDAASSDRRAYEIRIVQLQRYTIGLGAVLSIVIVSAIISTIRIILPLMREDTSIVLWSEVRRTLGAYVDLFASTTGVPVKWAPTMVPSSLGFYGSLSQIINFSAPSMF
jgi:hypothetical protein